MAVEKTKSENPETSSVDEARNEAADEEAIRRRAYEISQREDAGSAHENWQRAEAELQGAPDTDGQS